MFKIKNPDCFMYYVTMNTESNQDSYFLLCYLLLHLTCDLVQQSGGLQEQNKHNDRHDIADHHVI